MKMERRVRDALLAFTALVTLALGCAVSAFSETAGPIRVAAAATETATDTAPMRRVVIRFLTDSDFPPFNFYDEDGVLVGFNVDLARAICLELGTSCDIKPRPWEELFAGLKRGEADAVIAAHKVTGAALKDVDFTDRYFHTPGRFAGRREQSR
jgi:polar amino acid transport system substrate-binding protein